MTLIAAISCTDGVIIASDSASSDSEIGIKTQVEKIRRLRDEPILYAGSGDVGLIQKISESLNGYNRRNKIIEIRKELQSHVVPVMKEAYNLYIPSPPPFDRPPSATLLFVGVTKGDPWIIEIERDGRDTLYDKELGCFDAIGSGKPWAQALFRKYLKLERDLKLGQIFAYRVLEESIEIASAYLCGPIHIHTIDTQEKVNIVALEGKKAIADTCEAWRELEREAVGELLKPNDISRQEVQPEIPKPVENKDSNKLQKPDKNNQK